MLRNITFSMVETFKKNLRKDMARSFVAGSTIMDDLKLNSPKKSSLSKQNIPSISNLPSSGPERRKFFKAFKLGDKQMKVIQKAFGEEKITRSDVLQGLKECKNINILPYSIHSKCQLKALNYHQIVI